VTKSIKVICIAAISLSIIGCSDSGSETVEPNQQITQEMPKAETPQVTSPSESVSAAKVEPATAKIRSADSHVHGGATLSVVSEKNLVMVELEMITFNADSGCRFDAVSYDISLFKAAAEATESDDHSHAHEDDDDHKHDDSAYEHNDEHHDHKDADDHDDHSGHKDVLINYTAQCSAPEKLKNITVEFFDNFPNLTNLELVYLSASVQRSTELSAQENSADISK